MIEFGGKTYTLGFGMKMLKAWQAAESSTVVAAFNSMKTGDVDAVLLSKLFRAACKPEVSEDEADEMIDAMGLMKAVSLLGDAATAYFTDPSAAPQAK